MRPAIAQLSGARAGLALVSSVVLVTCGSDSGVSTEPVADAGVEVSFDPNCTFELEVVPDPIDFGEVVAGTSAPRTVRLTNRGLCSLSLSDLLITGSADFSAPDLADLTLPLTIETGSELRLEILYSPQSPGFDEGSLSIVHSSLDGHTRDISLTGEGIADALLCTPDPIQFGATPLGTSSRVTVNCTNDTPTTIAVTDISFNPEGDDAFILDRVPPEVYETNGLPLTSGETVTFIVLFEPPPSPRQFLNQLHIDWQSSLERFRVTLSVIAASSE